MKAQIEIESEGNGKWKERKGAFSPSDQKVVIERLWTAAATKLDANGEQMKAKQQAYHHYQDRDQFRWAQFSIPLSSFAFPFLLSLRKFSLTGSLPCTFSPSHPLICNSSQLPIANWGIDAI